MSLRLPVRGERDGVFRDIRIKVGNRIRQLRKELLLSQESLAFKAGLDRTYIASVENGKRNLSIMSLEKIIVALDCSVAEFFETFE
ncbi:helix-turn-helix domain-containing protein [Enterocloster bolteae]|nr:helix-turn-helix domain-containing protein [Enterocloster bolteae]